MSSEGTIQAEASARAEPPYTFEQTLKDVTVEVPVPEGLRAKNLDIKISKTRLFLQVKGADAPIIDGELHKECVPGDSTWTKDGAVVQFFLTKRNGSEWWACVCKGDPELDTTKIEPETTKMADLDPETRAMVAKMKFDMDQKARGLPSSDELQKQEMLKSFMDKHPEMDFSQAKIG